MPQTQRHYRRASHEFLVGSAGPCGTRGVAAAPGRRAATVGHDEAVAVAEGQVRQGVCAAVVGRGAAWLEVRAGRRAAR